MTGGAQYYFHDLSDPVKTYLRAKGAVRVALVTPYGATKTDYFAVSTDRKLDSQFRPVKGNVGHDRIQQGRASESIGEAIRIWYKLSPGDFERIDVDIDIIDNAFYLTPLVYKYSSRNKGKQISRVQNPLTFTKGYVSEFWTQQLASIDKRQAGIVAWSLREICRVVQAHYPKPLAHIQESDILRASGPLKHLGCALGGYVGSGYDCASEFTFLNFPTRAVILCGIHDHKQLPKNIDVIELRAMCDHISAFQSPAATRL